MRTDEQFLDHCRMIIEDKLGWGNSNGWQNQDFEILSERIASETRISLSPSTLKRIWGKVKYASAPNSTTLNTLARFVGYDTWRDFRIQARPDEAPSPPAVREARQWVGVEAPVVPPTRIWVVGAAILLAGLVITWAFQPRGQPLRHGAVRFTSRPVTRGVPNTVLFQYDATDSNADSVFIQQSWNPRLRFRVAKNRHHYASTYYYPGYFRAKLILNDSVVKEHDLYLVSDGWLGTIDRQPVPIYFRTPQRLPNGYVGLTEADVAAHQPDLRRSVPWTTLTNVRDLGDLPSGDFTFETELISTFNRYEAVCQRINIVLLCSNGHHLIPLSVAGCVGELSLTLSEKEVTGQTHNLSGFGVDFSDWVKVRCDVRNKQARVFVNGRLAYEGRFREDAGKIVGVRYRFHGTGTIKSARFYRRGRLAANLL